MTIDDPMERMVREALKATGVDFVEAKGDNNPPHLDFYLPDHDLYIEVKQFHSERIAEQMSRAANVVVAQGRPAVEWLAGLLHEIERLRQFEPSPDPSDFPIR